MAQVISAAEIRVYSDLSRIDEKGNVVSADRGAYSAPREILSPAVVRNAFASFHLFVQAAPKQKWSLYIGQNPEDAVKVTLRREVFVNGVPSSFRDVTEPAEGEGSAVLWLDLFVPRNAEIARIKIEPQLQVEGSTNWITYPMEVRILSATVARNPAQPSGPSSAAGRPADTSAIRLIAAQLCGAAHSGIANPGSVTPQDLLLRNFEQDMSLLRMPEDTDWLWLATKASDRKAWCKNPVRPPEASAEWWLRIRDRLYRR